MKNRTTFRRNTHARGTPKHRTATPILFRLDDGYVVLDEDAAARGAEALRALARDWAEYHAIAITSAPEGATAVDYAELGRAAQAFDRVVICESGDAAAATFARAIRGAGRTECHVVADAHRALRHCIEGMVPGDVVAYCCGDVHTAARILAEYGAVQVRHKDRDGVLAGIHVAPNAITGELTATQA